MQIVQSIRHLYQQFAAILLAQVAFMLILALAILVQVAIHKLELIVVQMLLHFFKTVFVWFLVAVAILIVMGFAQVN